MIDIIKAKKDQLLKEIAYFRERIAYANTKLEVYDEVLAELTKETATVEETHVNCDCASCSAEETAQNDITSNI